MLACVVSHATLSVKGLHALAGCCDRHASLRLCGMIWRNRRGESKTERRVHDMTGASLVS